MADVQGNDVLEEIKRRLSELLAALDDMLRPPPEPVPVPVKRPKRRR